MVDEKINHNYRRANHRTNHRANHNLQIFPIESLKSSSPNAGNICFAWFWCCYMEYLCQAYIIDLFVFEAIF
jgi:hypothetical protein